MLTNTTKFFLVLCIGATFLLGIRVGSQQTKDTTAVASQPKTVSSPVDLCPAKLAAQKKSLLKEVDEVEALWKDAMNNGDKKWAKAMQVVTNNCSVKMQALGNDCTQRMHTLSTRITSKCSRYMRDIGESCRERMNSLTESATRASDVIEITETALGGQDEE
ncbi:MAG: hypothetical protein WC045_00075 [Patescibacteria group bacterium]